MAGKLSGSEKRRKYNSLLKRDGNACFWCEVKFSDEWPFTIDHLITQADGGNNRLENMVLACDWCNNKRSNMAAGAFMAWIRDNYVRPEDRPRGHLHPDQVAQRANRRVSTQI